MMALHKNHPPLMDSVGRKLIIFGRKYVYEMVGVRLFHHPSMGWWVLGGL